MKLYELKQFKTEMYTPTYSVFPKTIRVVVMVRAKNLNSFKKFNSTPKCLIFVQFVGAVNIRVQYVTRKAENVINIFSRFLKSELLLNLIRLQFSFS